jgi:hypothetical protein
MDIHSSPGQHLDMYVPRDPVAISVWTTLFQICQHSFSARFQCRQQSFRISKRRKMTENVEFISQLLVA